VWAACLVLLVASAFTASAMTWAATAAAETDQMTTHLSIGIDSECDDAAASPEPADIVVPPLTDTSLETSRLTTHAEQRRVRSTILRL